MASSPHLQKDVDDKDNFFLISISTTNDSNKITLKLELMGIGMK